MRNGASEDIHSPYYASLAYLNASLHADSYLRWLAKAPAALRIALALTTAPMSLIHGLVLYPLSPVVWPLNIVTGHRYNSTWGLKVVRTIRAPILLIVPLWLLSHFVSAGGWVMFGWMVVYLVLRQFNGAARFEMKVAGDMEEAERLQQRLGD